jgi:hypothetical protein
METQGAALLNGSRQSWNLSESREGTQREDPTHFHRITLPSNMGPTARTLLALVTMGAAWGQDPYELVRRSIAQNQLDWARMADYTWRAQSVEKHLDSLGNVERTEGEVWETLMLDGQPYRRTLERDGKLLSPAEQQSEQKKLDRETRRLSTETPNEKQRRMKEAAERRRREFAFLSEIPELFELRLESDAMVEGRAVWVVSGAPRPGAKAKSGDAKVLLKLRGRMWIDKSTYQWTRVEAETTDTISWGVFLARLNSGARMIFEQTEVSAGLWFPKRLLLTGKGRVGLLKRLAREEEVEWSHYRKFSVDSKIIGDGLTGQPEAHNIGPDRKGHELLSAGGESHWRGLNDTVQRDAPQRLSIPFIDCNEVAAGVSIK